MSLTTQVKMAILKVVEWLHRNRVEGCTTNAMDWASQNGHLKVVEWLHLNRVEGCTTWAIPRSCDYKNKST